MGLGEDCDFHSLLTLASPLASRSEFASGLLRALQCTGVKRRGLGFVITIDVTAGLSMPNPLSFHVVSKKSLIVPEEPGQQTVARFILLVADDEDLTTFDR